MRSTSDACDSDVFVSYASHDREQVVQLVRQIESAGVTIWRDQNEILGGENYGPKIVHGIRHSRVLLLLCSNASMRSRNVKQEIQLAWHYEKRYLPLLIEPIEGYPEQIQYWLEGTQWIEVFNRPVTQWLPRALNSLATAGVESNAGVADVAEPAAQAIPFSQGLAGLRALARFTDQLWPLPAENRQFLADRGGLRDLGAPQDGVQYEFRLGSRVCLAVESDRAGHLLLLDEGTSGKIYCLCPSDFAPDAHLASTRTYLPQQDSKYNAFVVSGKPGREHLLAIITDEPLGFDWMPSNPKTPARLLSNSDINALLSRLRELEANRWTALSTYFDVIA